MFGGGEEKIVNGWKRKWESDNCEGERGVICVWKSIMGNEVWLWKKIRRIR